MKEKEDITTVKELIAILKTMPENMPVLVNGYESGYENFYQPMLKKVEHFPENMYYDGAYQLAENLPVRGTQTASKGMEAVILQRVLRDD